MTEGAYGYDDYYGCLSRRYSAYAGRRHSADNEGMAVRPSVLRDSYFRSYCLDNHRRLGVSWIICEFAADRKAGRRKKNQERIDPAAYEKMLLQHADESRRQMMRPEQTLGMLDVVCGNVLDMIAMKTLQIRLDMDVSDRYRADALYYDFLTADDCVDAFIECFGDPSVCGDFDDAYDLFQEMKEWAEFGEGQYTSDYAALYAMSLCGNCPADPDVDQAVVCLNRCLDIIHGSGDVALAFIEGGTASLNRIRYAHGGGEPPAGAQNKYFYDEPMPKAAYDAVLTDFAETACRIRKVPGRATAKVIALGVIRKENRSVLSDLAKNPVAASKFEELLDDVISYFENRRLYGDEYVRDVAAGLLWFRMKRYAG